MDIRTEIRIEDERNPEASDEVIARTVLRSGGIARTAQVDFVLPVVIDAVKICRRGDTRLMEEATIPAALPAPGWKPTQSKRNVTGPPVDRIALRRLCAGKFKHNGSYVAWADATREILIERIEMFNKKIQGHIDSRVRCEKVVATLDEYGVKTLGELLSQAGG